MATQKTEAFDVSTLACVPGKSKLTTSQIRAAVRKAIASRKQLTDEERQQKLDILRKQEEEYLAERQKALAVERLQQAIKEVIQSGGEIDFEDLKKQLTTSERVVKRRSRKTSSSTTRKKPPQKTELKGA